VTRPIVFVTDYGLGDEFVGVCHGVIARIAPAARVIDLTHAIRRQDVLQAALVLARAVPYLPEDAVLLGVVDPGVGSTRRAVCVRARSGTLLVGPDNGLLSMAWRALGGAEAAHEVVSDAVLLHPVSRTFHGRDVFAPAAAHLAAGAPLEEMGPAVAVEELVAVDLPGPIVGQGRVGARVVAVDGFGNVQLNATPDDLAAAGVRGPALLVGTRPVPRADAFAEVPEGTPAVLVDSQGFVALAVNRGNAAELFSLAPGDTVVLRSGTPAPGRAEGSG
jgi:hypothetical protein